MISDEDLWGCSSVPFNERASQIAEDLVSGKRVAVVKAGGMFSCVVFPKVDNIPDIEDLENFGGFLGTLEWYVANTRNPDKEDVQAVVDHFPEGSSYRY